MLGSDIKDIETIIEEAHYPEYPLNEYAPSGYGYK